MMRPLSVRESIRARMDKELNEMSVEVLRHQARRHYKAYQSVMALIKQGLAGNVEEEQARKHREAFNTLAKELVKLDPNYVVMAL